VYESAAMVFQGGNGGRDDTPPKFNSSPLKLEDDPFLLGASLFLGAMLNFRGVRNGKDGKSCYRSRYR